MGGFSVATDRTLIDLDQRYRALYDAQVERLVPVLGSLTEQQWRASSRNEGWTVQQTMQHVAGVLIENVRVIEGGDRTWSVDFDPHRSPQQDIDTRAGESPAETVAGWVDASQVFRAHLASRAGSEDRTPMLWGEPADFRLFHLHLHWDAWVHERDMLLPLGIEPPDDVEARRFAVAYAVLFAGVAVRMSGRALDVALAVPDLGRFHLDATADAVRIDHNPDSSQGHPVTDPGSLVDALSGRGDVDEVVDAPTQVVAELARIGSFLRG